MTHAALVLWGKYTDSKGRSRFVGVAGLSASQNLSPNLWVQLWHLPARVWFRYCMAQSITGNFKKNYIHMVPIKCTPLHRWTRPNILPATRPGHTQVNSDGACLESMNPISAQLLAEGIWGLNPKFNWKGLPLSSSSLCLWGTFGKMLICYPLCSIWWNLPSSGAVGGWKSNVQFQNWNVQW